MGLRDRLTGSYRRWQTRVNAMDRILDAGMRLVEENDLLRLELAELKTRVASLENARTLVHRIDALLSRVAQAEQEAGRQAANNRKERT